MCCIVVLMKCSWWFGVDVENVAKYNATLWLDSKKGLCPKGEICQQLLT